MKLSVKSDYASRAVLGLAQHYGSQKALKVEELAEAFHIPANYLIQILIDLKAHGIVKSVRGKEGGYLLARPPKDITLGDIIRTVHGPIFDTSGLTDAGCPLELRQAWESLQKVLDTTADQIQFQQLAESSSDRQRMYYI